MILVDGVEHVEPFRADHSDVLVLHEPFHEVQELQVNCEDR